jgi:hypothetical protein
MDSLAAPALHSVRLGDGFKQLHLAVGIRIRQVQRGVTFVLGNHFLGINGWNRKRNGSENVESV